MPSCCRPDPYPSNGVTYYTRAPDAALRGDLEVHGEVEIEHAAGWGFRGTLAGRVRVPSGRDGGGGGGDVVADGTYDGVFFAPGVTFAGRATGKLALSPATVLVGADEPRRAMCGSRFCLQGRLVYVPGATALDYRRRFWSNLVYGHHGRTQLLRRRVLRRLDISSSAIDADNAGIVTVCSMGFERIVSRGTLDVQFHVDSDQIDTRRFVARFHVVDSDWPFARYGADALFVDGMAEIAAR
ncbi:hypothetical protein GGTG_09841 [Gaeumannomyces tritici R3-111a-1]|uniref:Uncharacterized protein n=1 Tax=Gaeumannomyces tritici (strain R3-111a-1) TaxID=644352 RepID=J3P8K7_GAET3|nr:hypothetical protein GGTG_09841 [Gaeumannomyces tritici R3-111a-1]EJT72990.1 hypothetical protein GGTG_09841 [Gaeumannomyces tritici R3-111a-1]